jgi:4-hydroxythreonine-4-phosphate dehydrogenase
MAGNLPIALTCGEPAGVAPEITAKAWAHLRKLGTTSFLLVGDAARYAALVKSAGLNLPVQVIDQASEAAAVFPAALPVLNMSFKHDVTAGMPALHNAATVMQSIERAVELCLVGQVSGMVTNPIQKETLYGAGFKFQGHTDYLGHLARSRGHKAHDVMMLVAGNLRAVPVTVHIPLADVPEKLTTHAIVAQAKIVAAALQRYFGVSRPRLAITGLNPHAGENGTIGTEEQNIIMPAIERLRASGFMVAGPLPADTAFHAEARNQYDAILCMYHDQALIPAKTLDFHGGVNVTLGLPFIRTSPDHGTALTLAGKGTANPTSLIAALALAHTMAQTDTNE